jgi:hypothetical protein
MLMSKTHETKYGVYLENQLVGHVVARQRKAAIALLPPELQNAVLIRCTKWSAGADVDLIAASPLLGVEPITGNPKTSINPKGCGRRKSGDEKFCANFGLSPAKARRFRSLVNKSRWLKELIEQNI